MSSGKGGNNKRRPFKNRDRNESQWSEGYSGGGKKRAEKPRYDKNRGIIYDRPKWTPVKAPLEPLPILECPLCGKPIRDLAMAVSDKDSQQPAHFDCVTEQIAQGEILEKGDTITYIGRGRFGIVHFSNPQNTKKFTIKKILEWEDKDNRAEWRKTVADHYSVT
ncbi:MAG: hypothetical protein LBG76_02050 [Treponema sp.]|jgi:hypothetical protein|nr:hypothetical protein [Treponema sp.]